MQSKRKSSWKILVVAAAANLLAVSAQAIPDAPHDASNNIGCLTCHQMTSTYPKLLPPNGGTPLTVEDSYANRMCISCHDGSGSSLLVNRTHSRASIGSPIGKYGDWTVECWVCHNEHKQEQAVYGNTTGYIRKSINLANIKKPDGTTFGKAGNKSVVFTGPATYADGDATYNGICEICHTQTTYHQNSAAGDHNHNKGGDCVGCHKHDSGFTGGAVHNTFIADDSKAGFAEPLCSSCHTNYATSPETAHSACSVCHSGAPALVDNTFATYDGQVDDDGTSMYANLIAGGYLNVGTGRITDASGNNISGVPAAFTKIKCGVCHAAKPDALAAVPAEHGGHPATDWDYSAVTNDCVDCHDDGGKGTIEGVHSNTCTICHVDPAGGNFARKIGDAAKGVDGNALLASGRNGDCLTCHPGATYTKTKIHHDTANAVATPTNGCTTACHNTTTGHAGNHNTLVAIQNPPCQGCHNAAAAIGGNNVPVDATAGKPGSLIHDYCTSCHVNPSGDLIGTVATPTAHATTMNNADGTTATNNGGGTCTACHTAYFDGHAHKTAHTMPTVALCLNCHTATSAPYSDAGDVHADSGCMTCHDAANGALKGSAVAATGGENCQGCHSGYFASHDHADTSTGTQSHGLQSVALCEGCHTPYAAGAAVSANIHDADGCFTCHNSGTGTLQGSAASAAGTEDCQGCHTTYFDGHGHGGTTATPNHTQTITKDALCGNCHGNGLSGPDAITAPYTAGNEAHSTTSAFGCMTCHSPVNGAPIVGSSAANWGATWGARASGTCATCHTDAFSGHSHTHTFTATADCATCHGNPTPVTSNARDAVAAPFIGVGEVHEASGCATCHNAGTGALIGSATGHAAATGCIDCHTATWTDIHDTAAGVTHATRVEPAAACTTCHGNPTPATSNARDAQATPYLVAGDVHATGCGLCHTGNNNGGLKAGPLPKADTVAKGTCTTCHAVTSTWTTIHDTATGAVTGVSHATRVDGLAACTTCHTATAGGAAGVMPFNAADSKVHDACSVCHTAAGALNGGNTTYGNQPIAKGTCGTCHTAAYFNSHVHGTTGGYVEHDVAYVAGTDISQVSNPQPCGDCHNGNNADGNGVALNSWTDILSEHVSGCARCHSYTDDGNGTPPQATNDNTIASGSGVTCTTCHTPKLVPAASSDHGYLPHDDAPNRTVVSWTGASGAGADPDCKVCHDDAATEVVYSTTTHGGTCGTCHAGIPNPLQGTTALALAMPSGGAGTNNGGGACVACHTASYDVHTVNNANQASTLHNNVSLTYAETTGCNDCHGTDGADAGTTPLDNWVEIVSLHTNCAACHSSDVADVVATIQAGRSNTAGFTGGNTTVDCDDCHITDSDVGPGFNVDSAVTPMGHGQTAATVRGEHNMFSTSGITGVTDCANCHDMGATDVVASFQKRIELHTSPVSGAANTCLTCHVGQGDPANAQIASGIGGNAVNCNECHTAKGVYTLHGLTEATVGDVHDKFNDSNSTAEKYCGNCHITTTAANRLDLHVNCLYCHDPANTTYVSPTPTTTGTPAPTVVQNGRSTGGNTVQTCENCHAVKGDYTMHGLTDNGGADGVADVHNNFNSANGQTVTYTGKLSGAYGGLKVTSYSCGDCHAPDPNTKTFSDLNVLQLHTRTNGTGIGDCLTCHVNNDHNSTSSWMTVIKSGRSAGTHLGGGGNALVECEDCHQAAYDADTASGEKMYQYDGVRHHKTANAQAGNCTYCHADPRPTDANPGANPYPYAATADTVGTYQTGWNTDYSLGYGGTIPKQVACRLCHTNYGTDGAGTPWSVNVLTTKGNHGYNLTGTAAQRTTGLTVWANDFNAGDSGVAAGSSSTDVVNAYKVVQNQIHRIEPNNGSAMINVNDYGSCLGCHSVQVMHAAPVPASDYPNPVTVADGTCGAIPWDTLRYAPGRAVFNRLRGGNDNNQAWNNHRLQNQNGIQTLLGNTCQNRGKNYLKNNEASTWDFNSTIAHTALTVPLHASVTNFNTQTGAQVMYFTNITTPTLDDITITMAQYTGSAVVVYATNTLGSGQTLSFTYTGGGCGTTGMTWSAANSRYEGTCNTPSGYTEGTDSVTVANTTTTSPLDTRTRLVDLSPVAATAVNDNLTSAATGGPYALAVLANDTGTSLKVASVSAVTKSSGAGTCGTVANNTTSVGYTPGGGNAVCTFTYQAQAYNGAAPYGAPSQATVTVTQSVNTAPTITVNQPDGTGDTGFAGGTYNSITYNASDAEADPISVDFYYDTNNSGADGTAIASCQNLTSSGTGLTCSWTSLPAAGTYYVYGIIDDGITTATAYSAGTITVAIPPVTRLNAGASSTEVYTLTTADSGSLTYNLSGSSSDNRVLIVAIAATDTAGFGGSASNITASYGNAPLTEITESTQARESVWLGYCDETCIASATDSLVRFSNTVTAYDYYKVQVMTFANVNQSTPTIGTASVVDNTAAASLTTASLTMGANNMPIYTAGSVNTGAHSVSTTASGTMTELFQDLASASQSTGHKTDVTAATSGTITVTFGGSARCSLAAAVLRHMNN